MSYVLLRHNIVDYARWRTVFESLAVEREASGSLGVRIFQSNDTPNEITLLFSWTSAEAARRWFESDILREAMERAGVQGKPEIVYLDSHGEINA
jgi:heme-degrading monooxygenase HmoA